MIKFKAAIAGTLSLLAVTAALAQSAPATMDYHTVYGRIGAAPGDTGPGQAIPFAQFTGALLNIIAGQSCATSNWVRGFGSTGTLTCSQPALTDLTGTSGIDTNLLNAQSSNYVIAIADNGKTVYMTGGPSTVTLPAVAGFASNAVVNVCNGNANTNATHAQRLSGFPNPVLARLYQQQCVTVAIENGAWIAKAVPGRFRPTFAPVLFVDNGGSGSNDGLISNAAANALLTMQQCFSILQNEYDLVAQQPTCSPTGGQTLVGSFSQTGLNLASSVTLITGNGGVATLRPTPGGSSVFTISDFGGYFIATNAIFDCTGGATTCFDVFFHQEGGADCNAGCGFIGAGTAHQAINCDGRCKVNVNSDASTAIVVSGSFGNVMVGAQGSSFVFNNGLTVAASTAVASDFFLMSQGSRFQFRGAFNGGAGTSVGGALFSGLSQSTYCLTNYTNTWTVAPTQKFKMLNFANLYNVSANVISGTAAGIVTAAGFANGAAPDAAAGNTGVNAAGC